MNFFTSYFIAGNIIPINSFSKWDQVSAIPFFHTLHNDFGPILIKKHPCAQICQAQLNNFSQLKWIVKPFGKVTLIHQFNMIKFNFFHFTIHSTYCNMIQHFILQIYKILPATHGQAGLAFVM